MSAHSPVIADPREGRATALFLLALAAYFAAQVLLRVVLGGSLEGDEAEMVVLARDWHFTYGSQPPLYNWYQTLFFDLFGVSVLGVVLAKNVLLFATYVLMFLAFRPVAGTRLAMIGALSLALIPNLAWWAQRTGSHSIALAALTAGTVLVFLRLLRRPGTGAFLLFGLVVGLGGLAKPNYWLVPPALVLAGLSMAAYRPILLDRRLWLSAGVALAVIALPYAVMLAAPMATFSDVWEFRKGASGGGGARWLLGLGHMLGSGLVELVPAALAIGIALSLGRRGMGALSRPQPQETVLLRAALIGFGLVAAGVVLADVAFIRARWMLPLFMLCLPPLFMALFRTASARARRGFVLGIAGLALLLLGAIADTRLRGAGSDSLRIDLLADEIAREVPDVPPLIGPHYYTGNLLLLRPGWEAFPPFPTHLLAEPSGRVLVIGESGSERETLRALREHGYPGGALPAPVLAGQAVLPYRFTRGETRTIRFTLYDFGRPEP
jgi:4-amino-4-deoxy-L-arabinose transferase-like glycosyltransferase